MVTAEQLSALSYCPETGVFTWNQRKGRARAGDIAGYLMKQPKRGLNYIIIGVGGKTYLAHRLAWRITHGDWPEFDIDHIDGDGTNNRISNLRAVNNQDNSKNSKLYVTNKSGVAGVRLHDKSRFRSSITVDGKSTHLGLFDDFFDAVCARKSAENRYGYHHNHGRRS